MSSDIPVPVEEPPWRPEAGSEPEVTSWPPGRRPALRVWDGTAWQYAPVQARHTYPDGRTVYQVLMPVEGGGRTSRSYRWPQPGLRRAHAPAPPSAGSGHIDSAEA
ncbi:hypothetical protein [Streptomyces fradiae]|uniref:hypothetical protein n=1 Tax=Streptomyces fradiae TaxID=1906 RepID=UPI0035BEA321